jgi:enoyl-CoA hydratase/carnithine racemase
MTEQLCSENRDGVLVVTFNRPEKKNAINTAMWVALKDVFRAAAEDDSVRCVLLCGAGDNFCAGVDLASFGETGPDGEHPFEAAARAVVEFDKPMVAAAQGVAVGGGATILFHADIVYVGESLRLRLPFASLGLVPEWGSSYMLQANIPDHDLFEHAYSKAREIAQWPVKSLREIKRSLRIHHLPALDTAINAEQAGMERQAGSPENIEAITAFMEKRPPDFSKV